MREPSLRNYAALVLERIPDAVIILDGDGVIGFANAAAERLFGRARDVLVGSTFGYPVIEDSAAEVEIRRPDGTQCPVEVRAATLPRGDRDERIVSLRDVTERSVAEQRMKELERERIESDVANRAKSRFLAVMSHELRTPLNAILGYADLLAVGVDGALNEPQSAQVERLQRSARHLLTLVNDVLDLSRLEAGRLSIASRAQALPAIVDSAVDIVRPAATAREISLTSGCDGKPIAVGDESRVRQILVNLLQNAVKFTEPHGSVELRCGGPCVPVGEARVDRGRPYCCVSVRDSGPGIPADKLSDVFDPFVRVEAGHTRTTDGAGLGLTISRRLARLMQGDLTVRSVEGEGSTFTLWLPAAGETANAAGAASHAPDAEAVARARQADERRDRDVARAGAWEISDVLLRQGGPIVASAVSRIRHERAAQSVDRFHDTQLANHLASFLAVLGETMGAMAEHDVADARRIEEGFGLLRLLARRHGRQRARLHWTASEVQADWRILQAEVDRVLRESGLQLDQPAYREARELLQRMFVDAESRSQRALHARRAARRA